MTDETIDHFAPFIYTIQDFKPLFPRNHFSRVLDSSIRTCLPEWRLLLIAPSTVGCQMMDCIWLQNTNSITQLCPGALLAGIRACSLPVFARHLPFSLWWCFKVQPWRGSLIYKDLGLDGGFQLELITAILSGRCCRLTIQNLRAAD